jgi:hypothetical protein
MFIKTGIIHGIRGAKAAPVPQNLNRMIKAEIANKFIESTESMSLGAEVGKGFASRRKGLRTRAQECWNSSVMRDGSEANP